MKKIFFFVTLFFILNASAQKLLKGTVIDSQTKDLLIGVTIIVKGDKTIGATTDFNGAFFIE